MLKLKTYAFMFVNTRIVCFGIINEHVYGYYVKKYNIYVWSPL